MPVVELNEGEAAMGILGDKFLPAADQKKFVSTWAKIEGDAKDVTGFPDERDLAQRIPFGNGSNRGLSGYERAQIPGKGGKMINHVVSHNGCRMVEMVHDRESVDARDKWTAQVSLSKIDEEAEKELKRLDRLGIKRDDDNMKARLVSDEEDLPNKPPQ